MNLLSIDANELLGNELSKAKSVTTSPLCCTRTPHFFTKRSVSVGETRAILINHTQQTKQFVTESQMNFMDEVLTFGTYKNVKTVESMKQRGLLVVMRQQNKCIKSQQKRVLLEESGLSKNKEQEKGKINWAQSQEERGRMEW